MPLLSNATSPTGGSMMTLAAPLSSAVGLQSVISIRMTKPHIIRDVVGVSELWKDCAGEDNHHHI